MTCAGYADCSAQQRRDGCSECVSTFTTSHVAEWQRLNSAQLQKESANLRRGFSWALLFSVVFYGIVFAVWFAL